MRTRKLGKTDLEFTTAGLGTWAIGGPWQYGWGPQDDDDAVAAILAAIDEEINWIDTAPIYGLGHSEELVGRALREMGEKPLIATKCGLIWNGKREKLNMLKAGSIINECHASLKRLGVDTIDLYQMHWNQPEEDIEEAWQAMSELQQSGKVRYIGVSNFTVEQIQRVQKIAPVASLQPPYSMLNRGVEEELLGFCGENSIGVVAYSPMQRGLLTGKYDREKVEKLPADDHRHHNSFFQEPQFSATLELLEELRPIAEGSGHTLAQLSISWVLQRPEVTSAIVGARKPSQIQETAKAGDWQLSQDEIDRIEQLLQEHDQKIEQALTHSR